MDEAKGNLEISIDDGESDAAAANHKPLNVNGLRGQVRRSSKSNWTEEEDAVLQEAVHRYGGKSWKKVANCLPGRTDTQCLHRWQKVLNPDFVKGPWNKEEDKLLVKLVTKQSGKKMKWAEIATQLPGRMGKQCRERFNTADRFYRWHNHLNPEINKSAWTPEEEKILINAHCEYGNKWSEIAKILPGRTENSVKNHWNCSLVRKLSNLSASGSALNNPQPIAQNPIWHEEKIDDSYCLDLSLGIGCPERLSNLTSPARESYTEMPLHCTTDISWSCSVKSQRQSDTYYTGLCYEPIHKEDMNVFTSTPNLPTSDGYLCRPSSPNSLLRIAAMSYDKVPSIIRKRGVNKASEEQKLEKLKCFESVGKCLEQAFSDA